MNSDRVKDFSKVLDRLLSDINRAEIDLESLYHSAKRSGILNPYSKVLTKLRVSKKAVEESRRDFKAMSEEHIRLLDSGLDSEKYQNYNYNKFDISKLPVKKLDDGR